MKVFLTVRQVGTAKSDIVFTLLTSSIFLSLGRVETNFTLHSLTRIIHIFKYSFMTGTFLRSTKSRFSQVYVSGLDEVDRVMILEETNIYIVYILNYYIL